MWIRPRLGKNLDGHYPEINKKPTSSLEGCDNCDGLSKQELVLVKSRLFVTKGDSNIWFIYFTYMFERKNRWNYVNFISYFHCIILM